MRRRNGRLVPPRYVMALAAALVLALVLSLIVGRLRGPGEGVTPAQLQHIEAKNREAAMQAAAVQRAESQASAETADREAALRDAGNDAAPLTRFETANGSAPAIR